MNWEYSNNNGKTVIYVVRVNNYWPELCEITIPVLKRYAEKIGADFCEITERKYIDFPPTYEKMQVFDLGKENEWNILIDADFLLHPLTPDFRKFLEPNYVGVDYGYDASIYLDVNSKYFKRDGRNRGIATGLVVTHNIVHDLWTPLDCSWNEAKKFTKREFIIDEYCVSRNVAKFGLKYIGLFQEFPDIRKQCLIHLGSEEKDFDEKNKVVENAKILLNKWGI